MEVKKFNLIIYSLNAKTFANPEMYTIHCCSKSSNLVNNCYIDIIKFSYIKVCVNYILHMSYENYSMLSLQNKRMQFEKNATPVRIGGNVGYGPRKYNIRARLVKL